MNTLALAIAACTVVAASLAQAQPVAERPTWKAGDKWTFSRTDLRTGVVTEGWRAIQEARADGGYVLASSERSTVLTDANLQEEPTSGPEFKGKWYKWPLRIGDEWTWELPIRMQAGNGSQTVSRKVVTYEKVNVPAGEFDCFRIVSTRTRFTYDARKMSRPGYSSRTDYTTWYCPAIRFDARVEEQTVDGYGGYQKSVAVLTSYKLAD